MLYIRQPSSPLRNIIPDSKSVNEKCFNQLRSFYDNFNGGFGNSTKFPKPGLNLIYIFLIFFFKFLVDLDFLLMFFFNNKTTPEGKLALEMVMTTLEQMSRGGIFDHLGKVS